MKGILNFIQEIFMVKNESSIGLSQFRKAPEAILVQPKVQKQTKEVKISDLMRRSY